MSLTRQQVKVLDALTQLILYELRLCGREGNIHDSEEKSDASISSDGGVFHGFT